MDSTFMSGGGNGSLMRFVYGMLTTMSMFITAFDKNDRQRDIYFMNAKEPREIEAFDFVIVGGGTAGAILANRLSEKYKILLLEAGGESFPLQSIPGMAPYMMQNKEIDWMYKSVSQKDACKALNKHRTNICQGKGLGGSSNMGFMNFIRGSPFDYENWANITENSEWKYSSLLPFFRRFENYNGHWNDPMTHGFEGEFQLQTPNYTGMGSRFIAAGMELNYKMTDLSGLFTEGFDYIISPLRRGYRQTSATAYINNVRPRAKMIIKKFSEVRRVLFRKETNDSRPVAFGVSYERHGKILMALATKEIILSAGAVNTPKLLMLSGVGPKTLLEHLKIPVVKDLPVGKNLQDHLITYLGPFMLNSPDSFLMDRDLTAEAIAKFGMIDGQGPLTSTGIHANGVIASSQQKFSGPIFWPDLHLTLFGMSHHMTMDKEFGVMFNMNPDIADKYFNKTKGKDSFSIIISLGRPFSRGKVRIPDSKPDSMPLINPKYLSDPRDMDVMLDGIYRALSLIENSNAFKALGATLFNQSFPGCEAFEFRSQAYWQCYVRHFSMSANNLVGTCSMGPPHKETSVVDSELKVLGVDGLRVIDSSVIPSITVGGTLPSTMVVAEKGADLIRRVWDPLEVEDETPDESYSY